MRLSPEVKLTKDLQDCAQALASLASGRVIRIKAGRDRAELVSDPAESGTAVRKLVLKALLQRKWVELLTHTEFSQGRIYVLSDAGAAAFGLQTDLIGLRSLVTEKWPNHPGRTGWTLRIRRPSGWLCIAGVPVEFQPSEALHAKRAFFNEVGAARSVGGLVDGVHELVLFSPRNPVLDGQVVMRLSLGADEIGIRFRDLDCSSILTAIGFPDGLDPIGMPEAKAGTIHRYNVMEEAAKEACQKYYRCLNQHLWFHHLTALRVSFRLLSQAIIRQDKEALESALRAMAPALMQDRYYLDSEYLRICVGDVLEDPTSDMAKLSMLQAQELLNRVEAHGIETISPSYVNVRNVNRRPMRIKHSFNLYHEVSFCNDPLGTLKALCLP